MKLTEMRKKYLSLIEELSPDSEQLTEDPDIAAKQNEVVNQRMYEMARMKKIFRYVQLPVTAGQLLDFETIGAAVGSDIYQLERVCGVSYDSKAGGTLLKILEDGTAEIDCAVYPERITDKTNPNAYEFELSADALEVLPYGIAGDLLMADASADNGVVYRQEYERQLSRLDPRSQLPSITLEGGVDF